MTHTIGNEANRDESQPVAREHMGVGRRFQEKGVNRKGLTAWAFVLVALSAGCSSHHSSLREDLSGAVTLYGLSRSAALQLAHNALSEMFPGRKITDIQGPPSGYSTSYRMMLDTYSQQVLVIPAIGIDATGNEVRGYYFEVSGSGTAIVSGSVKNSKLFERVVHLAEQVGQPVRVTNWRADYREEQMPVPILPSYTQSTVAARLQQLKQLRREELISEDEYREKRAKILNEM